MSDVAKSLMNKFKLSSSSVFDMGVEALAQLERDINDTISFGQCIKACYYKQKNLITEDMVGKSMFTYIYIYAIYMDGNRKVVAYKENDDKEDFNLITTRVKTIEDNILSCFL